MHEGRRFVVAVACLGAALAGSWFSLNPSAPAGMVDPPPPIVITPPADAERDPDTVGVPISRETWGGYHFEIPDELMQKRVRWAIMSDQRERHIRILLNEHIIFDNTVEPREIRPAVWIFHSEALKPGEYTVTVIDPESGAKASTRLRWPKDTEVQIWLRHNTFKVEVDVVSGWR